MEAKAVAAMVVKVRLPSDKELPYNVQMNCHNARTFIHRTLEMGYLCTDMRDNKHYAKQGHWQLWLPSTIQPGIPVIGQSKSLGHYKRLHDSVYNGIGTSSADFMLP